MKHGKKPTVAQCEFIAQHSSHGHKLNPDHWLVIKDTSTEMEIYHRGLGTRKTLAKMEPLKRHSK